MYPIVAFLLFVLVKSEAQVILQPDNQSMISFRSGLVTSSVDAQVDSRLFLGGNNGFGSFTLTLNTVTSTSTVTTTTTCTTTTVAVSTCSPSGRRRRGLALNNSKGRALFYADDEEETEEGSIFAPWKPEEQPAAPAEKTKRETTGTSPAVPFIIQPGFNAPENARGARFLVTFATSTIFTTSTSTYTIRLTAICQSSTGFSYCPNV